jgi:4,5-dihydroxyphthalate decarboxylase
MRYREFDVSELSFSSYLMSLSQDPPPFIAIPVFLSRSFRHSGIYVNADSGIREPRDLVGKRVGCAEYQLSANVWIRGILDDDYGVRPSDFVTVLGGMEEPGRPEKTGISLPADIRIEHSGPGETLSGMLESGRIDALFTPRAPSSFIRRTGKVRRLFEDTYAVEREYYERTRIFPIMHVVAIRRPIYETHRWVAQSLYKGFVHSQRFAYEDLHQTAALKVMLPWLIHHLADTEAKMGADFWSYGCKANAATIDTFLRYHFDQGLSRQRWTPEKIFAPETLESFRI